MAHTLDGCHAKIQRANEHIHQIHTEIVAGKIRLPSDALRLQHYFQVPKPSEPDIFTHELVFSIQKDPPPVPLIFSVLAGEATYQLRSALDHLVYQAILAHTNEPPTFNSAFPIIGKGRMAKQGRWRSAPDEYVAQTERLKQVISGAAEAIIHGLQPFQRGAAYQDDPLWILQELNNTDKHRLLVLTVHAVDFYKVDVTLHGETVTATFTPGISYERGAEIGRMPCPGHPRDHGEVSVDGELVVQIAFDKTAGRRRVPVIPCLTDLANYVERITQRVGLLPEFSEIKHHR
jgi:hypothetical protein